jgi:hypothetical protein
VGAVESGGFAGEIKNAGPPRPWSLSCSITTTDLPACAIAVSAAAPSASEVCGVADGRRQRVPAVAERGDRVASVEAFAVPVWDLATSEVQRACNTSFEFGLSMRRHLDKKPISQHAENASPKMMELGSIGFLGLGLEDEAGDGVARSGSSAGGD